MSLCFTLKLWKVVVGAVRQPPLQKLFGTEEVTWGFGGVNKKPAHGVGILSDFAIIR